MNYAEQMTAYALQASQGTGLPVRFILAQWAHETGWGTSDLAVNHNNHGGIKFVSEPTQDYNADGQSAGYTSVAHFVADYVRVINLSYYASVRAAAAQGADPLALADIMGRTAYAEDPDYGAKLRGIVARIPATPGEAVPQPTAPDWSRPVVEQTGPGTLAVAVGPDLLKLMGVAGVLVLTAFMVSKD